MSQLRTAHGCMSGIVWAYQHVSEQSNMGDVVGVSYRLPDQEEVVDEAFFIELEEVSCSQALMLMGNYNHSGTF